MIAEQKKRDIKELRQFGLTLGSLIAVIFGLLGPFLTDHPFPVWPWIVSGILCIWAILAPKTLYLLHRFWMGLGGILGFINTRIILTILFFGMMFPIGLILRMMGKDLMSLRNAPDATTYRITSENKKNENMEKPF